MSGSHKAVPMKCPSVFGQRFFLLSNPINTFPLKYFKFEDYRGDCIYLLGRQSLQLYSAAPNILLLLIYFAVCMLCTDFIRKCSSISKASGGNAISSIHYQTPHTVNLTGHLHAPRKQPSVHTTSAAGFLMNYFWTWGQNTRSPNPQ
jgi:hypothetical protein